MLNEQQLEILSDTIRPLFQSLERDVIMDIARRVEETLSYTQTAEVMAEQMQQLGYSPNKIRKEVMKLLGADKEYKKAVEKNTIEYKKEIKKLVDEYTQEAKTLGKEVITNAGEISWNEDLSLWKSAGKKLEDNSFLQQLQNAIAEQTAEEFVNLTRTTGFKTMSGYEKIGNAFRNELDKAAIKICTGTFSQDQVISDVVHNLAKSGLRSVNFESGYSMQLDTAVKNALRTGCAQISAKIMDENMRRTGENLVYVSKHWGARNKGVGVENHELWQGKVYFVVPGKDYSEEAKRIGQDRIMDIWYSTGYSPDGSHPNNPLGLHGYYCRHSHRVWFEGISVLPDEQEEPAAVVIDGKIYDYYARTQKLRAMERNIRNLKRERIARDDLNMSTTEISKRIKQKIREYEDFCKKYNMKERANAFRVDSKAVDITKTKAYKEYKQVVRNGNMVNEQALISAKTVKNNFSVNREIVNAKTYHDKFEKLSVPKPVYEAAYREAGRLLEFVDGKEPEHMIALNARTGELIVDNFTREGNATSTGFNDDEYAKILECKDKIILLHNHSHNVRPSGGDIVTYSRYDNVSVSLVLCHDGDVFSIQFANKSVENIYNDAYNYFRKDFDSDSAKALATKVLYEENEKHNLFEVRRL